MKQQQVNKLYSKLTPHEQVALLFEAAIRHDESEVDLILDSVERRTYSAPHVDFQQRVDGLTNLSGCYGIFYWKTLCQLSALLALSLNGASYDKAARLFINKINSMDVALEAVCKELNIDVVAIKKFAECSDYQPKFDVDMENLFVEQYTELFSKTAYLGVNNNVYTKKQN